MSNDVEHAASIEPIEPNEFPTTSALSEIQKAALVQGATHISVLVGAVALFAIADSWVLLTNLGLASVFAMLAAFLCGLAVALVAHEWGHYLGARLAGARVSLKSSPGIVVYDYDFDANTPEQFLAMSIAGSVGNLLAILLVWLVMPLDSAHREFLLASTIGVAGFVAYLEWPIIKYAREHQDPAGALAQRFGEKPLEVLTLAVLIGLSATTFVYWLL